MVEKLKMDVAEITEVKSTGSIDRCCIDLSEKLKVGEGMLVGMLARALFLVHSETVKQEWTNTRPFRVNAGPLSAYVLSPEKKRKYLSELKPGVKVVVVNRKGNTREVEVARNKMELRPSLFIKAYSVKLKKIIGKDSKLKKYFRALRVKEGEFYTFLQRAETIMLVNEKGEPVRADLLKKGDKVLAWVENPELVGTHFGTAVKEKIIEF